jgi:hypothetical protein
MRHPRIRGHVRDEVLQVLAEILGWIDGRGTADVPIALVRLVVDEVKLIELGVVRQSIDTRCVGSMATCAAGSLDDYPALLGGVVLEPHALLAVESSS